ncbi:50S ribosomal protein L18 [Anaerohalosphaera lusitana]|uniref:Large ribosomal subunit protein uL18 n=1 Tax=Anaerohalosphaera lusitana TaxID=1936003 RepID=A0A1U9NPW8_9BACT|nr:50S ribosomal protein L18 [Anaerohalosphaera lusitana]AQT69837.1 50S ribosomal protein L18 [Anaerohalosphaera lusitana]
MGIQKFRQARIRRKKRVRKKVYGTPDRPRMTVFRSGRHIYVQVIDDIAGVTLASSSTMAKGLSDQIENGSNKKAAETVGEAIAKEAIGVGIKAVRFDRNGYRYQGRVKALADGARKGGLVF